jgi:hypothetical protein
VGICGGTVSKLIALRILRLCLLVLGGFYLTGGVAAVSGFFQMRTGPADLADWFSSNGMPPSRFLVVGVVYCAIGLIGITAVVALRNHYSRGRLVASLFILLVALDFLADFFGKQRTIGLNAGDLLVMTLTGGLWFVAVISLVQGRHLKAGTNSVD